MALLCISLQIHLNNIYSVIWSIFQCLPNMTLYQLSEFLGILVQTQIHISFRNIWLNHKKQCNGNMRTLWLICVLIYRPRFFFCSFFQSVEKVCWVKGLVVLSNKFVFSDFWFGFHSYSLQLLSPQDPYTFCIKYIIQWVILEGFKEPL